MKAPGTPKRTEPAASSPRLPSWAPLAGRLAIGGVLVVAGTLKGAAPAEEFSLVIESYDIVPPDVALTLATFIPWVELLLGFALLTGTLTRLSARAAGALLLGFLGALLSAKARGIALPNCGCFGPGWHPSLNETLTMDSVLAGLCLVVWRSDPGPFSLDRWIDSGR